jgi:hypothetical protein
MLSDPRIIEVLNKFKRLSFQTTYLDISKISDISKVLREHYSNLELEFNIIIEPEKINNDKYLKLLQDNQESVISEMDWTSDIRSFGIMNIYDYGSSKAADMLKDYDYMHQKVEHLFETTIDFNFSIGRKDELASDIFRKAANTVKDLFDNSIQVSDNKSQYLRFSFGRLHDSLIEKQYNWNNGKFYYSPLLYERYVAFLPEFLIPMNTYTSKDFEVFEESVQLSQYNNIGNKEECQTCPMLGSCIDRGILHLMDVYGVVDCLVAKKAMNVINVMGTLPA